MGRYLHAVVPLVVVAALAPQAAALTADEVVIVANANLVDSMAIAQFYAEQRGIDVGAQEFTRRIQTLVELLRQGGALARPTVGQVEDQGRTGVTVNDAGGQAVLGGLGGLVLGRVVSWILEIGVNAYARTQDVTVQLDLFAFPLWLLAATVLFSIVVSVLAGVYPALRAARVDPIKALRRE